MINLPILGRTDCTLLWDLDGTIADTRRDIAAGVAGMLSARGLGPLPLERVIQHVGRGVRVLVAACLAEAKALATPSSSTPTDPNAAEIDEAVELFRRHYRLHLMDTTVAYGDLPQTLRELRRRGRRMAVVSNKPEDFSREIVERLGLLDCFVAVLGGDSLPRRKPDPEPLLHALRLCKAAAGREDAAENTGRSDAAENMGPAAPAAVIGDSIIDARAARSANLPIAGVAWGFDPDGEMRAADLDWWFETPEELGKALLKS